VSRGRTLLLEFQNITAGRHTSH